LLKNKKPNEINRRGIAQTGSALAWGARWFSNKINLLPQNVRKRIAT